uniref:OSJNBb0008G24.6 protein n=1 Tax=Oryza sativa subsp. japonica TaxID=39947 RepID=Q7F2K4_ORYSJ|nr:OSJNBb0008G24.6 [Oryza sativa Japonica Group]
MGLGRAESHPKSKTSINQKLHFSLSGFAKSPVGSSRPPVADPHKTIKWQVLNVQITVGTFGTFGHICLLDQNNHIEFRSNLPSSVTNISIMLILGVVGP